VLTPAHDTELREKWKGFYERAFQGEAFDVEESYYNRSTDQFTYTVVSFFPIKEDGGRVSGIACFGKDVTELKKAGR